MLMKAEDNQRLKYYIEYNQALKCLGHIDIFLKYSARDRSETGTENTQKFHSTSPYHGKEFEEFGQLQNPIQSKLRDQSCKSKKH